MFLSIITINRNNAEGLKKTLDSVSSQTCRDFEHIIIDGASTDNSVEIIKEYILSPAGKNVSYWVSEPDAGVYNAMNKGIPFAKGEYCLFLNSGDWLVDDILLKISKEDFIEDVIYFNAKYVYSKKIKEIRYPDELSMFFFYSDTLNHQNIVIKTDIQKVNLFDLNYKIASDRNLLLDLFMNKNACFRHCNYVLSYYEAETGISNVSSLICEEFDSLNKKYFPKSVIKDFEELNSFKNRYFRILVLLQKNLEFIRIMLKGKYK